MVKAPIFQGAIKLRNVLDCQAKILEAVMDRTHVGFVDIIFIIFRLFHCYPVVLLGSSHLLCLACQNGLQWVVRRKGK